MADYARVAYSLFADRVKTWITLNEPYTFCLSGYNLGVHPPLVALPGIADYICIKNVLVAHAKAWRIYDKEFRSKYNGVYYIIFIIFLEIFNAKKGKVGRYEHVYLKIVI